MREYNASSYTGKKIIKMASRYEGQFLADVYDHWSAKKQRAYDRCIEAYYDTENYADFSICSHNAYGFTISWTGTWDGENVLIYVTKDNAYLVWMER